MGVEERYKKKTEEKKAGTLYNGVENRYLSKNIESVGKDISNRVNTWLENNKTYFSNAQKRFSGENAAYRTDTSEWMLTVVRQRANFQKEAENIKSVLNQYKDVLGQEYVNSVYEALDGNLKAQESIIDASNKDHQYWAQWSNKDEYDTAVRYNKYQKKYEGKGYDEVMSLLGQLKDGEEKEWLNARKYDYLANEADFKEYSQKGASIVNPSYEDAEGWANIFGWRPGAEDVGNIVTYSRDNAAAIGLGGLYSNSSVGDFRYSLMTESEVNAYNYYLGKYGEEKASEFLASIDDELTKRYESGMKEGMKHVADTAPVLSSAISPVMSVFSGAEYLSDLVTGDDRNLMADFGTIIRGTVSEKVDWEIGNWDAFDFVYNTGMSMADSLVNTTLFGGFGGVSLGLSAAAQATNDALDRGLTKDQAFWNGITAGVFEGLFETVSIGSFKALQEVSAQSVKDIAKNIGKSMLVNASEEALTEIANITYDLIANGELSNFEINVRYYMEQGMSEAEAKHKAAVDLAHQVVESAASGALMGVGMGGIATAGSSINSAIQGADMKKTFGSDIGADLATEAVEIDPNNPFAQKMKAKVDRGETLSSRQIGKLVQQNETAMYENDVASIQSAVEQRLTELGQKGNIKKLAEAITKKAVGEGRSVADITRTLVSKYGQLVSKELNPDNIRAGKYNSAWAEKIGTDRINAEEYGRLLKNLENEHPVNQDMVYQTKYNKAGATPETAQPLENADNAGVATQETAGEAQTIEAPENATAKETATEAATEGIEAKGTTATLESASAKYGAQAGAMARTYTEGQDVAKYDAAYSAAYEMGKSGVNLSYAMQSESTAYLTEKQRELAHAAGVDAANTTAKTRDAENKAKANGKTGRKKGAVKGEGVTISDLKKSFNDTQGKAYKLLSTYAEATGVDIVLYKSEANADGRFEGAQGKFKWSEDTIYIDINAGLATIENVDDLMNYTMMRTFSHEFSHFIEKWNPVWYNEFRKVVFDTLTERGEDVNELISFKKKQSEGMTYDQASREVVAEAMTDILTDANFVEELATKHKTIFDKLLEMLKEFVADLKAHFASLANNGSREANALKEQIGDSVKYVENIVKMFDKIAVEAVENYQMTVATEEAVKAEETAKVEEPAKVEKAAEKESNKPTVETYDEFTVEEYKGGLLAIDFKSKPSEAVIKVLEEYKIKWIYKNSWYGTGNSAEIAKALQAVYATEETATAETVKTTERDHFTITDDAENKITSIKFDGKPVGAVREILKANAFVWSKEKGEWFRSGKWYGKSNVNDVLSALDQAYAAEEVAEEPATETATEKTATDTLREMGGKAVGDNMTDVTDLFFPELAKKEAPKAEAKEAKETDAYDDLTNKLLDSMLVKENGLDFSISGNDKNGYYGTIKRQSERLGAYPVENARDRIYRSGLFDTYKEAVDDIVLIAKIGELLKVKEQTTNKEVKPNVENADNQGTVQQPDTDRAGDPRVLGEVEAGNVQGNAPRGDSVGDSVQHGQEAGRDGSATDNGAGTRSGSSDGDSQSRDLRRDDVVTPEAERLHEEVTEQIAQQSTEQPKGRNYVIGDSLDIPSGDKAKYKANIDAIKLVRQLETEGRHATEAEQQILSKYVGWGGLSGVFDQRKTEWSKEYNELKELLTDEEYRAARASTTDAFYTDIPVVKAMYAGLETLGFTGGRMLEPSAGVGNFVGAMPSALSEKVKSWTMVELDGITGLIAKHLYPNSDVRIQGFEKTNIPDNYMDVVIGNVPFGENVSVYDKAYPKKVTSSIHNYFFAKAIDKVRPGGIVMFITATGTMNNRDSTVRNYIMKKADLLGAIRLPNTAFKSNAGTNVVADILILKKRADKTSYSGEDFLEVSYDYNIGEYTNTYFAQHPEMVLGVAERARAQFGWATTYKPIEGKGSLSDQIREAFSHIEGKMEYPATLSREKTNFAVERATRTTKENGLVVKDGKVYQNKGGELVEVSKANGAAERIAAMIEIRDLARNLMNYQQQGLNEAEIKKARTSLNKAYDAFVKKYGFINSQANRNAFSEDPDRYSLLALENWNPDTKKATKADIFSKNTIAPNRTVTSAKDVFEGLIVSVNQTGGVDTALIARLTGKTETEVARELIDSRKAFKNRNGNLETAETYLSGNVRAKLRDAEALVPIDGDYAHNVEALKAIMPEDVGYQDIFVNPGTPWIPNSVYSDFVAYMLDSRNTEWRQAVDVTRNAETGNFTVELKDRYLKTRSANTQKWGTNRRSFLELFDAMLNSKSVVVKDKLADGSFVINKDATAAANEKIENIQKEFQDWLWRDEARRAELTTLYNEVFNSVVTPKYNGESLTVNGMNAEKSLRPHQKDAVQRVISSGGNTLLAHRVGAGKTYEMAAAAMKLKELGLVKKPMFVVPKSLVAQWGKEFLDIFPTAKLLVAEAADFTASNRKVFMNRVANGEYDAVIVSYEQFEKLPMSDDFTRQLYQEQIDSIVAAIEEAKADKGAKALSVKDLEKKRKSLQAKIDKLTDKAKDEGNIDFEQLGVDSLFVDEAHNFKNLLYTTSMTNVAGLGNKDGSKRAFDLYTKVRYLQQLNGGRGIVFATATPVMNSMSEMYIMQKYLQPDLLNQLGLSTFDAWAKQFGEVVNGVEIKPSGQGYRVKQSFSRFKNMSELQLLFRNFADVLTDIPGLKIPKMKGGKVNVVVCEPGQFQQDFMGELEKRADNIKNVDPSEDNMLKITSDGRKISYTQRMIDPSLPYEEGCKIYRCAENVIKEYNESKAIKGTQIVFLDMATPRGKSNNTTETEDIETDMESAQLYDDLKTRLRQGGIPAKEIAFIHEADTDQKKKKLFEDVNEGRVRVLIGSTGKMGVGMNAQRRIVAIHHLDAPWRPGDVEQRDGRAFRQGNINEEVSKYTYVTEGSFDARLWDILERKQNFINQVMNGENVGRETEDTGEVTLSAAEVKALASGSPLILEQVQLDTDIKKLESLYRAHTSAIRSAKERLVRDNGQIATLQKQIENGKADVKATVDTYSDGKFSLTVGNKKFTDKKEAGAALMEEATAKANHYGYTKIGTFAGFELRVIRTVEGIKGQLVGKQEYEFKTYPGNTTFMINHLIGIVEGIDEKVKLWQHNLAETQKDIAEQEKLIAEPFAKQAELDQKRARYNEVMDILNPKEEQSLDSVDEDTVQEQSRTYLGEKDASGNSLTAMQSEYFKDSKARDKDGNLLVLYHGTANAGFTVFDPNRGKLGGNWFTTSKKDADSYAGNYTGKLFDPAETDDIRTATAGNFALNDEMRFDSAEDLEKFKQDNPGADGYLTDAEIYEKLETAQKNRDWDEYENIEEQQYSAERKRIRKAYARYEWEHSREATLGELLENPERFTVSDVLRAWDAYDSNNAARDEEYTKEELINGLREANDRLLEEDGVSIEDLIFKARIPAGESGDIVNRANNRTYAVYVNVTKPYVIEAHQQTLAGGNLYPSIAEGLSNAEYDGVIVHDARVGAHQEIGDVVIIKAAEQVKLTSNKKPTAGEDISYQQRTVALNDREVLAMAADALEATELTDAERDALKIFKSRLSRLEGLQEDRAEQGKLYKEQQFGANVDREAAKQTLNRMQVLDDQIKKAKADILSLENKEVLGSLLKKARKVVETEQRAHDAEIMKRYREREKEAAAVKKYRERIVADVDELSKWVLKPDNKNVVKHIPDVLKNTVIPFITSINFTSKQQLRGKEATNADKEFMKRLTALNSALKEQATVDGLYSGYTDLPPNFMERLQDFIDKVQDLVNQNSGEFVINKMTSEELKQLSEVVRNLKAYITQINKFHANAMYAHVYEAGDDTIAALSPMESDNGKSGKAHDFVFWQQIRPAYAFERFGRGGVAIYDGLRRGQAKLAFNTKKILEFTEKLYTDKEVNAWEKEVKEIKISAGTVKMRISDMMSLYELSKQPDSLRHMLGEGIRVATYTVDGKKISDNGHALNKGDIKAIVNALTQRQKDVADAMQKFMAQQGGAWGNEVSVKRFGEEQFTNEQYFPINSDGRHLQSTADENPSEASLYALLNMSFTKTRNEKANNRIIVYSIFDVFANHMASMAQYNAMALPVLDAIKWFNYQYKTEDHEGNRYVKDSVREQMARVYGVADETRPGAGKKGYAESFVLNILKAFNGTEAQGVPTDTTGMNALRRYNMAQVAYNFRVVVQQPLAITRAALLLDYGSIIKGMKLKPAAIKQNIEEMQKYSGIAAWKSLGFYDTNISRGLTETIKHSTTVGQKIGEIGMWGAEKADTLTWAAMWSACKEEVIKKQGIKPTDGDFYEAVTELFEDVVYKTQVVDSVLTKNQFLRSKGLFARLTGSFMSESTATASMLIDAVDKYNTSLKRGMSRSQAWEKNKRMIGRTMYVYGVSAVILAAVQAVADAFRDDDDYEEWYEKWLEAFGGNFIDEVMPLNKLPLLADFYDLSKEVLSIFGVDTYGNPPQSVYMQWYDSLVKGVEIIYQKIAGEDTNYTYYSGIYKLLQAVSGITGLPGAAAMREIVTAWNNTVGAMAPSLKLKSYDSGDKNEIKYAYQDGYLTAEEATEQLLEQGLVDNEDEAYFIVQGWEAGEGYNRYDKVYEAVRTGASIDEAMKELLSHGYTEKQVIGQIKGKIGEWYRGGEVSKQQATNMLNKYTNMDSEEITKEVNKWSCVVVTGIEYDDIDDEFMDGKITASRAIEMYVRYGGMAKEEATKKVTALSFVKEHPILEGESVSYSFVEAYNEYCEPQGIDVKLTYDVWKYAGSMESEKDDRGEIIVSKKEKVLEYIDSLDLSRKQKDALYYALGYAKSTIKEAPWR